MAASFIHKNRALFIDSDLAPLLKLHVMKKHRPDGCLDNMKLNYSHGSGETERLKRRGKNVESHDYLKNVDSIKRKKKQDQIAPLTGIQPTTPLDTTDC